MSGDPGEGSPSVFLRPNLSRLPMKPLVAVLLSAREYPQKYHWKTTTLNDITVTQMSDNADFLRARPEYKKAIPGTMSKTIADETMMYAWSPALNGKLRLSTAARWARVNTVRLGT